MEKVLLADDDFTMVALLKTLLEMEGYQVATLLDKKATFWKISGRKSRDILLIEFWAATTVCCCGQIRNGRYESSEDLHGLRHQQGRGFVWLRAQMPSCSSHTCLMISSTRRCGNRPVQAFNCAGPMILEIQKKVANGSRLVHRGERRRRDDRGHRDRGL